MKKLLFIFFSFVIFSCNNKPEFEPKISIDKMTSIITDLHLSEAYVSQLKLKSSITIDTLSFYRDLVYSKHNVSEKAFNQSMKYYSDQPNILKEIYLKAKNQVKKIDLQLPHLDESKQQINSSITPSIDSINNRKESFNK